MYLFQRPSLGLYLCRLCIYIPLCIYFNLFLDVIAVPSLLFTFHYVSISTKLRRSFIWQKVNLHSTMYLFQLKVIDVFLAVYLIYIPLCIYFNLHRKLYFRHMKIIYIPLCIYFNASLPNLLEKQ